MWVAFVAEVGLDAGGFVEERELADPVAAEEVWEVLRVAAGLVGYGRECDAGFLASIMHAGLRSIRRR